ncbi:hypothetical protein D2Q93_10470 [Alicyclobacillaceae bacterium I2511]|nr:hypothetical protein D2Q93_10470 [Alicyclobacillaceae bacterium I2511]
MLSGDKFQLRTLYTGYFASVMATGIISILTFIIQWYWISAILFSIGWISYLTLIVLYSVRLYYFSTDVWRDLCDPMKMFGYFTFIAASDVLALRSIVVHWITIALILSGIALVTWVVLAYFVFIFLIIRNTRPIQQSVNGSWLIFVVATQSLSIILSSLTLTESTGNDFSLFAAYCFWAFGILIYVLFIILIIYRLFFRNVNLADWSPPYWINMGAMAITTVAGIHLEQRVGDSLFLNSIHAFIRAISVMMWAWGTWWIPLLIIMEVWKYPSQKFVYHPSLWSIVFPLGMYTTALTMMVSQPGLTFLQRFILPSTLFALGCWLYVGVGAMISFGRILSDRLK